MLSLGPLFWVLDRSPDGPADFGYVINRFQEFYESDKGAIATLSDSQMESIRQKLSMRTR